MRTSLLAACLMLAAPLLADEPKPRATLKGHTDEVTSLAFTTDGKTLASGSADRSVRLWEVASGKCRSTLKDAGGYGWTAVAFSPDGKTLASGGGGGPLTLWDVATAKGTPLGDRKVHQYACPRVVFSPDGKTLASGGRCLADITVWDVAEAKKTATLKGHDGYGPRAIAFLPDGKGLLSAGFHGGVRTWDVATGENTATAKTTESAHAAAFTADGKTLAASHHVVKSVNGRNEVVENSVKLWDVAGGKEVADLPLGNADDAECVAFSPDGKWLAVGTEGGAVRVWDVAAKKEVLTLKAHKGKAGCVLFSPDGKTLATGGEDGLVYLWDAPAAK